VFEQVHPECTLYLNRTYLQTHIPNVQRKSSRPFDTLGYGALYENDMPISENDVRRLGSIQCSCGQSSYLVMFDGRRHWGTRHRHLKNDVVVWMCVACKKIYEYDLQPPDFFLINPDSRVECEQVITWLQ
jgi:hypothetical protein